MFNLLTSKTSSKTGIFKFIDDLSSLHLKSARIYAAGEAHQPEEQWAQVTMSLNQGEQYAVFERRLDDKLCKLLWW